MKKQKRSLKDVARSRQEVGLLVEGCRISHHANPDVFCFTLCLDFEGNLIKDRFLEIDTVLSSVL